LLEAASRAAMSSAAEFLALSWKLVSCCNKLFLYYMLLERNWVVACSDPPKSQLSLPRKLI